jgi:hypothetical protein
LDKFGRTYLLEVQRADGQILTVQLPFTIEFDITRNTLTSANICQIRIYNLGLENRNQLRFNVTNYGTFRGVKLRAGYGENPPLIFSGNISSAWSVREGVNFITQIECYDGGFAFVNGHSSLSGLPAGTTQAELFSQLIDDLPHVQKGAIGNFTGQLSRGNSYSGNTAHILTEESGGAFFVDQGFANVLQKNEYLANLPTITINSATGILGTPVLEEYIARFSMIFEPGLNVGQKVVIDSSTDPYFFIGTNRSFSGEVIVTGVKHRGMISDAVCGTVITEGDFNYIQAITPVQSQ